MNVFLELLGFAVKFFSLGVGIGIVIPIVMTFMDRREARKREAQRDG